jgi:hypothetical protein
MPQIYLLTILTCLLTGGVFAADMLEQKAPVLSFLKRMQDRGSQSLLGIVVFIFGIVKLFIPSPTETSLVLGDLLPALVGIVGGGILTIEALYRDRDIVPPFMASVIAIRKQYASGLGILFILIGLLHLILPGVILL